MFVTRSLPEGGESALTNTWALGRMFPGETKEIEWRVTALGQEVNAQLDKGADIVKLWLDSELGTMPKMGPELTKAIIEPSGDQAGQFSSNCPSESCSVLRVVTSRASRRGSARLSRRQEILLAPAGTTPWASC